MRTSLACFLVAALVSAMFTPFVRRFALRLGAVARPGGRHVHERSIPRLGGVAICLGFFAPLLALFFVRTSIVAGMMRHQEALRTVGVIVGGLVMCAVGFADDVRGLRALHKLYAQLAVAVLAFALGFRIEAVAVPLLGRELSMGVFALPVTVVWIVGIINAVNLIDGLDGLAGGVVFFAGLTNFVVASLSGGDFVAVLMASMLGSVLGFLFYNFNPARIFMGDSGSYFLGFVLATTSLAGAAQKTSTAVSLLVPIVALGVPIFDTLFAMVRRVVERRPIFSPDRGHLHHRLLDLGVTHRRAVLMIYGVCVAFTVAAIGISLGRSWQVGVAILGASVLVVGLVRFVGSFQYRHLLSRQRSRLRSKDAEMLRYALPDVPALFSDARSEVEVWEALAAVGASAGLDEVEVVETKPGGEERRVFSWASATAPCDRRDDVSARYPLGRDDSARADVKFRWRSDFGDVSPQSEVMLQIVVDVAARALARLRSAYAPAVEPAERPSLTPGLRVRVSEP